MNPSKPGLSRRLTIGIVAFLALRFLVFTFQPQPQATSASSKPAAKSSPIDRTKLKQLLANQPLAFELNQGQAAPNIRFMARAPRAHLLLAATEATLLSGSARFPFRFPGANSAAQVKGLDQLIERRNYFLGNRAAKWQTNVPTFRKVLYENIYPGINLTYYGKDQEIEYDFEVAPGANPSVIRLAFDRGFSRRIAANGDLLLRSGRAQLRERRPQIYQEINDHRQTIIGQYVLLPNREVGFDIGNYDRSK